MILGLDASTSTVGICILDEKAEIVQKLFFEIKEAKGIMYERRRT